MLIIVIQIQPLNLIANYLTNMNLCIQIVWSFTNKPAPLLTGSPGIDNPFGPCGPGGPIEPGGPCSPRGPIGPWKDN